jgi:hypothetical protein
MTKKSNLTVGVVSPFVAILRAIEHVASAREFVLVVRRVAQTQEALNLTEKLAADLDVTAKELTALLAGTKVSV